MTWLEWFQSLAPWQVWSIGIAIGFILMKIAEWNAERRAIEQAKAIARTTKKKALLKSKKKAMPVKVRKARQKMKYEIDRIMEKQGQSKKGFDNSQPGGLNDIL